MNCNLHSMVTKKSTLIAGHEAPALPRARCCLPGSLRLLYTDHRQCFLPDQLIKSPDVFVFYGFQFI